MVLESVTSNCRIRQQEEIDWQFQDEHFDPRFWQQKPSFQATIGGRGGSCLIELDGRKAVLRRYQRGGIMGRVLFDQYLWLGQSLSRPWREWDILLQARAADLPVPEPVAAFTCRSGLCYRAALVTAFLDDTEMMTQRLQREGLSRECWNKLGLLVKRMHTAGIRHADLTSDNILIDSSDRFYLVDFDKARTMNKLDDWQWRPLYRFQRSIEKRDGQQHLHYDANDWQALMDGYQS
jgi:3-deoxy-D-manno-octulosonic acid kinase